MGPLWRGVWDSTDVCDVVPNGSAHRFGSRPKGERLSRVLDEELFSLDADTSWRKNTAHSRRARTPGRRVSTERQANQYCMTVFIGLLDARPLFERKAPLTASVREG